MTLWFIIGPRGGIYRNTYDVSFCNRTRWGCICDFTRDRVYGGVSPEQVWASFEKAGYRCDKRTVTK